MRQVTWGGVLFAAGITAASGICADIGVPLTHRGLATSVKFLTGHSRDGGKEQLDEAIDSGAFFFEADDLLRTL